MNYTCPMCGYIGSFKPYGKTIRDNAMCPRCMSLERHRARALLLKDMIKSEMDTIRTLYVSPERSFKKFLSGIDSIDLTCIDIDPNNPEIDYVSDITRTQFEDGEFDIIICCDVLSEVRNDMSAIIEMSRIISPRGKILLDHPKREKTKRIKIDKNDPIYEKGKKYRTYGLDFIEIVKLSGFQTSCFDCSFEECEMYSLDPNEKVLILKK